LAALFELVRGFQSADDQAKAELLREVLAADPNHVYKGLLTVLMRLVFILYAEDRGLLSSDPFYVNYYAVTGLFDRLRADASRFPDTMDQRYGAWAQLMTLFRLIYEGGRHGGLQIPARRGYLFDPDRYNFLEGRQWQTGRAYDEDEIRIPRVSDGVIFRVLSNLLILDGERLSYRTLDVEQIGSVYEAIMGFNLEVAPGPSIAIKPKRSHGAPASINLEALLASKPADRPKWLKDQTDQALTGQALDALKKAVSIEDLLAALEKRIARDVTPNVVSRGAMVLQPSDERRRSGSHYTPRSLTEPIVRTTLRPILERLGIGSEELGRWGRKGEPNVGTDQLVSRSAGLATGDGSGGRLLPGNEGVSARRDVRADQPDSPRGGGDPGEHRGGPRPRDPEGTSAVPPDSAGQSARTGNAPPAQHPSRPHARGDIHPATPDRRATRPDAQRSAERSPHPTPHILTPNSYPSPDQILDLKICDPAMGSGAFLVEACRQLGDAPVKAWHVHDCVPKLPPDEDEILHARRIVAQRCLYGVDKNPMAVDLAKLSLWLATLAKDHPFTFLDHALRCGDSLVGLSTAQIVGFHWKPERQRDFVRNVIGKRIERATESRREIREAPDNAPESLLSQKLALADEALNPLRF
jgi:hypothetical protein